MPKAKAMSKEAKPIGIVGIGIIVVAVAGRLQRHEVETGPEQDGQASRPRHGSAEPDMFARTLGTRLALSFSAAVAMDPLCGI